MIDLLIMPSLTRGRRQAKEHAHPFLAPAAIFILLSLLTTLWALATPLMSAPDEPAHAVKAAAVARGQFSANTSGNQSEALTVTVPGYVAALGAQTCMAFKPDVTGACAPPIESGNRNPTSAQTTAGNYNPLYYLVVGMPSRVLSGEPAVYAMRILSGLMSSFFLTVAFLAAARLRRNKWPIVASVVALTPMVLYLSGSINPNSLEIVTTAAFFLCLCVVLENFKALSSVRIPLVAVAISGVVLANTRALSLIWLGLAVIAAVIVFGWRPLVAVLRDKLGLAMVAVTILGCVAGLAWLLLADSFKSLGGAASLTTPDQAIATMVDRTFVYVLEYIGFIGWLDTPAPQFAQIYWHFAFVAVLLGGLTCRSVRARWAIFMVLTAIIVLPPILQAQVIEELDYIWQGRYLLALVVLLFLLCGVAMRDQPFRRSLTARAIGRWLVGAGIAAHFYVFVYVLRRYTVGLLPNHTNWTEMGDPAWQPPLTWQVLAVAYLLTLAIGAVLIYLHLFRSNGEDVLGDGQEVLPNLISSENSTNKTVIENPSPVTGIPA